MTEPYKPPRDVFDYMINAWWIFWAIVALWILWAIFGPDLRSYEEIAADEARRIERARETDAFIARRAEEDAIRRRNEIVYDELVRQQVRRGN